MTGLQRASSGLHLSWVTLRRSGHRDRDWEIRAGTVKLRVPKLSNGSYFPGILEPRRMAGKARTAVIQEAHLHSNSARSAGDLVKAPGASGVSKNLAGRLCDEVDGRVKTVLERPIAG